MGEMLGAGFDFGLSQMTNVRDLGGIIVQDGRHVKKGLLARSESLSVANDDDLERLTSSFDLRTVIDFRMDDERTAQPDPAGKLPAVRFVSVPIINPASLNDSTGGKLDSDTVLRSLSKDPTGFLARMYEDMVLQERGRMGFAQFFRTVLETDEGAVLWHCTSGKDRTGMASALLLHVLGASDETIMADYLAVNDLLEKSRQQLAVFCAARGFDEATTAAAVRAGASVDSSFLQAAFEAIDREYGDIDDYLVEELSVTPSMQETLRTRYLEMEPSSN